MKDKNNLAEQLEQLAKCSPQGPDTNVEHRLLGEFREHHRRRRRKWTYISRLAAVLVAAFALLFLLMRNTRHAAPSSTRNAVQQLDPATLPGFVALPYGESGVPLGESVVMRVEMRASDLSALGVSVPAVNARQQIGADVLIGQDGVARAVRFHQ